MVKLPLGVQNLVGVSLGDLESDLALSISLEMAVGTVLGRYSAPR
jgi:hypothetical protein